MPRYINYEDTKQYLHNRIEAAKAWQKECKNDEISARADATLAAFLEVAVALQNQPAADVVPVVRCSDCKHYKDGRCFYTMRRHGLHDDWFCADGTR